MILKKKNNNIHHFHIKQFISSSTYITKRKKIYHSIRKYPTARAYIYVYIYIYIQCAPTK
jgi:hypothetical protein